MILARLNASLHARDTIGDELSCWTKYMDGVMVLLLLLAGARRELANLERDFTASTTR